MRWLVDECVDAALVTDLRAAGHDALYMADVAPASSDREVIRLAHANDRLLLTEDKDFGDSPWSSGGGCRVAPTSPRYACAQAPPAAGRD